MYASRDYLYRTAHLQMQIYQEDIAGYCGLQIRAQ
jgi:hypothetical protein